ncbi:hypothetical protein AB0B54_35600 [Microbispora bryophytorum]|uniref:hypothetical protein n=1 Tax=Microbispora bryophytorum TaxID=1460882 RepID=UPI0033EF49A1
MSLIDELSKAHAELEAWRDVDTALHAFLVASEAARAMEGASAPEEFPAWVSAGSAAFEGASALRSVPATAYDMPLVFKDADDRSAVTEATAALGGLLREVMAERALDLKTPDARLAALTASRCGTRIQLFLGG